MGGVLLKPQTAMQILRCLTLGRYTAIVEGGELKVRGLQPLADPLPASIKLNRDELIAFLNEWADGVWPPAPGSGLREAERILGCGLGAGLDAVEAALKRHAA
jgi:hypothetical protein